MTLGLSFWLAKRSKDRWTRANARGDIRHRMRQQWLDYGRRGRGNKAWKRAKVEQAKLRAQGWFTVTDIVFGTI